MLIYVKIIKKILIYDNFILIYVKIIKKKRSVVSRRTDTRSTQNYSSELTKDLVEYFIERIRY